MSSILNSDRAIEINIAIMQAFVKLREMLASNKELGRKLEDMECKYDEQFKVGFDAIRVLMTQPDKSAWKIGFKRGGTLS